MKKQIVLSNLGHTWILDMDGTLVRHNQYKTTGDVWLPGALDFLNNIPKTDYVLFLTGREEKYKEQTIDFLRANNVHYDNIIFGVPFGERILINDTKPAGLKCAIAIPIKRDNGVQNISIKIDNEI